GRADLRRRDPVRAAPGLPVAEDGGRPLGARLRSQARAPELLLGHARRRGDDADGRDHGGGRPQRGDRHGRRHHRDEDQLHAALPGRTHRQGPPDAPHRHHGLHRGHHLRPCGPRLRACHRHLQVRAASADRRQGQQRAQRHLDRL
ncbi:MAG: Thioesterase, partial [uncultured Ramlibacter sp.]